MNTEHPWLRASKRMFRAIEARGPKAVGLSEVVRFYRFKT